MKKEKDTKEVKEDENNNDNNNNINIKQEIKELSEIDFIEKYQVKQSFFDLKLVPIKQIKLTAPFPGKLTKKEIQRKQVTFLDDYCIKDNGLVCVNQQIVDNQSGIFKDVAMQLAKNLFKGSIISLSLPIRVFEEKSMLEKYCDWWINAPYILKKAGKEKDVLESFKLTICFCLSSLHFSASQLKPFNPLLGETLQMSYHDGTRIYLEHTSHHPCVTNFYIKDIDDLYTISGYYDMQPEGTMKMLLTNYVYLIHKGKTSIYLKTTNRTIDVQIPKLHFEGIVYGERCNFWDQYMKFEDKKNNLKAVVQFKLKNQSFDNIQGQIYKYDFSKDKKGKEFYESSFKHPFASKKEDILSEITGSYLGEVLFDNKAYYKIDEIEPKNLIHEDGQSEYLLPSDWRYREDINWLTKSNSINKINKNNDFGKSFENYSQQWKLALESQQRYDRKLRETNSLKPKKKGLFGFY